MVTKGKRNVKEAQVAEQVPQAVIPTKKKSGCRSIKQIFIAAKNSLATHPKLCLQLIKLYQKVSVCWLHFVI